MHQGRASRVHSLNAWSDTLQYRCYDRYTLVHCFSACLSWHVQQTRPTKVAAVVVAEVMRPLMHAAVICQVLMLLDRAQQMQRSHAPMRKRMSAGQPTTNVGQVRT